jgi:CubicO group peptidase (beta-lactamase class C family)
MTRMSSLGRSAPRLFLGLWCLAATAPASLAAQNADRFSPIRARIHRFLDSTGAASLSVAVGQHGKILWEEGFGWANRETLTPATPNTMYSLASISKPFTATGLMVLAERGQVDITHPANDYLGLGQLTGLAGDASLATVRRVMSHTAGLPLHYQFFYDDGGYAPPSMDETISRYGILVFPPGAVYQYCNLGYGIIDHIISRVSGRAYRDFMREDVFLPLGLTHTSVDIGPGLEPYAAERYYAHQQPIAWYTFDHVGASAVYSSAHDLVRFGMFHLKDHLADQRRILTDSTIDLMHRAVAPADYGLGWIVTEDDNGYRRVAHSGGMPGVATLLWLYPEEDLAIVMLVNSSIRPEPVAAALAGVMLPGYADSVRARRARATPPAPAPFHPTAALAGEWHGQVRTWQDTIPITVQIAPDGDTHVQLGDELASVLDHPTFRNGRLVGDFWGRIPTPDVDRHLHTLQLDVLLVDGKLEGMVNAQTPDLPRVYYSLASYVEMTK